MTHVLTYVTILIICIFAVNQLRLCVDDSLHDNDMCQLRFQSIHILF